MPVELKNIENKVHRFFFHVDIVPDEEFDTKKYRCGVAMVPYPE